MRRDAIAAGARAGLGAHDRLALGRPSDPEDLVELVGIAFLAGKSIQRCRRGTYQRYGDTYVIQIEDEAMKDPAA